MSAVPEWLRAGRQLRAVSDAPSATPRLVRVSQVRPDADGLRVAHVDMLEEHLQRSFADPIVRFEDCGDGIFRWRHLHLIPPFPVDSPSYLEWLDNQLAAELSRAATRVRMADPAGRLDLLEAVRELTEELSAVLFRSGHALDVTTVA